MNNNITRVEYAAKPRTVEKPIWVEEMEDRKAVEAERKEIEKETRWLLAGLFGGRK